MFMICPAACAGPWHMTHVHLNIFTYSRIMLKHPGTNNLTETKWGQKNWHFWRDGFKQNEVKI